MKRKNEPSSNKQKKRRGLQWEEKYQPKILDELSFSNKKLKEIQDVFESTIKSNKTLLIAGSTGVGKTTVIKSSFNFSKILVLAEKFQLLNCDVSKLEPFETFLSQSTRYNTLNFGNTKKKIILIKGLPETYNKQQRQERDRILKQFINNTNVPIILIHTVCDAPTINSSLYREFSKDLLESSKVTILE